MLKTLLVRRASTASAGRGGQCQLAVREPEEVIVAHPQARAGGYKKNLNRWLFSRDLFLCCVYWDPCAVYLAHGSSYFGICLPLLSSMFLLGLISYKSHDGMSWTSILVYLLFRPHRK